MPVKIARALAPPPEPGAAKKHAKIVRIRYEVHSPARGIEKWPIFVAEISTGFYVPLLSDYGGF